MDDKERTELFRRIFQTPQGEMVLAELKKFARYDDGQFIPDPGMAAYINGRRSVICEIIQTTEKKTGE